MTGFFQEAVLVGIYSAPRWKPAGHHVIVLAGEVAGGHLSADSAETLEAGFFDVGALPEPLYIWHRRFVHDTLQGFGGSAVRTYADELPISFDRFRQEVYAIRDQEAGPRHLAYQTVVEKLGLHDDLRLELGAQEGT